MQENKGSCRPFCLVLVRLRLFEPPIQDWGGEAGQDPSGEPLKCSGPKALLWGELEGARFADSDDYKVKTGCNSSPQAMQGQLKDDGDKPFSVAAVTEAMATSCDLGVRSNTRKNVFARRREEVTRQAVASPPLEVVKNQADRAMDDSIQCRLQPCFVAEFRLETTRGPLLPSFQQVSEIQLQGILWSWHGFHCAPQSRSCSRQCPDLTTQVMPKHKWDVHSFSPSEDARGKRPTCCSTTCALLPHWDF